MSRVSNRPSDQNIPQPVVEVMALIRPGMSTEEALEHFDQPADFTEDGEPDE